MAFGDNQLWRPEIVPPQAPGNQLAPQPTWADAADYAADWMRQQQAISEQRGLWNPQTGLPTQAGVVDAARQYGQGLLMGTTAPGESPPITVPVSSRNVPGQAPIVRFREDARAIESAVPPVTEGATRLWRGNRPGEVGTARTFTNDLPGIALPFREPYGGDLSYVDVPTADLSKYENTAGAAPGAEFSLPQELAAGATAVRVRPHQMASGGLLGAEGNPAFAKWFGKSKVVDEAGNPLVVYHGSGSDISQFDPGQAGRTTGNVTTRWGSFFSPSAEEASLYATDFHRSGQNVTPVHLAIENPYEMTRREWDQHAMTVFRGQMTPEEAATAADQFKQKLRDAGYDGVIVKGQGGFSNEYVAFDPTQIKSAVGNRGTFDPRDPRINYGIAGLMAGGLGAAATTPQQ